MCANFLFYLVKTDPSSGRIGCCGRLCVTDFWEVFKSNKKKKMDQFTTEEAVDTDHEDSTLGRTLTTLKTALEKTKQKTATLLTKIADLEAKNTVLQSRVEVLEIGGMTAEMQISQYKEREKQLIAELETFQQRLQMIETSDGDIPYTNGAKDWHNQQITLGSRSEDKSQSRKNSSRGEQFSWYQKHDELLTVKFFPLFCNPRIPPPTHTKTVISHKKNKNLKKMLQTDITFF
ncbi:hypothetical protein RFI_16643 [Reticulomyxa filosa]|uniref:Uncharacterized protein n=1 Tax=Reticulomyxa filosa TaxID=46433 RepID=X6N2S7_RETFI|nr:hypothetical protein RFI_16643 [Reticulomyxa filosa]|eukprot:ETO20575.1 hypothetical protein RFI_16643 [Reticulomyxa filosa]